MRQATPLAYRFIVLSVTFALLFNSTCGTAAETKVGDWGEPARIVVEGAKTFTAEQIRDALLSNFDVRQAGHPLAPLDEYPTALADHVKTGYLRAGFPSAKIETQLDHEKQQIVIHVDEGDRFTCGGIQLLGKIGFEPHQATHWLMSKQPPAGSVLAGMVQQDGEQVARWENMQGETVSLDSPAWQPSKPVQFDDAGKAALEANIRRAFAELGFPWAKFEMRFPTDAASHMANLQIECTGLGPPAKIGVIRITGNMRDSEAEIIKYLDLRPGTLLTESQRTALWHKLWMSGRFLKHEVELECPEEVQGLASLNINVVDYDQAPPLNKPLSREEQALLKCREWMLNYADRGDDLVCTRSGLFRGSLIVSPKHGTMLHMQPPPKDEPQAEEKSWQAKAGEFVLSALPGSLQFINCSTNKLFKLPLNRINCYFNFDLLPNEDPSDPDRHFAFRFLYGAELAGHHESRLPLSFKMSIAPVVMIGMAHSGNVECTWHGDSLRIKSSDTSFIELEASTGQLIKLGLPTNGKAFAASGNSVIAQSDSDPELVAAVIHFEPRAFERELTAIEERHQQKIDELTNSFDQKRPLISIAEFLLDDPLAQWGIRSWIVGDVSTENFASFQKGLHKALAAGLLKPLDEKIASSSENPPPSSDSTDDDIFDIPDEFNASGNDAGWQIWLTRLALYYNDDLFPRNSWPWIMVQNQALSLVDRNEFYAADIGNLLRSNECAPIEHLVMMKFYQIASTGGNSDVARSFAQRALEYLDTKNFEAELKPFLDSEKFAGKCVLHLAKVLRELDEDDANAIGTTLFGEHGSLLGDIARRLRMLSDQPIEKSLPLILDQAWSEHLRMLVAVYFREVSGQFTASKETLPQPDPIPDKKAEPDPKPAQDEDYHLQSEFKLK